MQEEEGVEALEAFEYHQNTELSNMAVQLVEKYFYNEEVSQWSVSRLSCL